MAAAGPRDESLAYVSRKPKTLERYVKLDQHSNGTVFKNDTRIEQLVQLLNTAKQALQDVDMTTINANVLEAIQRLSRLQYKKYFISDEMLLPFENYNVINDKLQRIATEMNREIQFVGLPNVVRSVRNLAVGNSIPFRFIHNTDVAGWSNIKNTVKNSSRRINSGLHSKRSITNNNIQNPDESNTGIINQYLEKCERHQVAYITKHNELKTLFKHLKFIIGLIKPILDLIRRLSKVKPVQKRRLIRGLPEVNLPQSLLDGIDSYQSDQRQIIAQSEQIISAANTASQGATATQQGGFFQFGGAAAAAAATQRIVLTRDNITVNQTLAEHLNIGDIIQITNLQRTQPFTIRINNNISGDNTFGIDITSQIDDRYIEIFNNLPYQQQLQSMNIVQLGIDHPRFIDVAGHLEQMMRNTFIEFDMQLDRMYEVKVDEARASNDINREIPFDEEHRNYIQGILYNCYDLQILYLIKHVEVVNLFKFILFHYDILLNNLAILINLLKLFDILHINIAVILDTVSVSSIIDKMGELIKQQKNVMSTVASQRRTPDAASMSGGARPAPAPTDVQIKTQLDQSEDREDREVQNYIDQIKEALKDKNIDDVKLSRLEQKIGEVFISIHNDNYPDNEHYKEYKQKLYKAYQAIRILRLKKLEQRAHPDEFKQRVGIQIANLKQQADNPESGDLFSTIGRIQAQDDILNGVYHQYASEKLQQSPFTKTPVEGQSSDLQPILDTYYKLRSAQVCKVGDPDSCSVKEEDILAAKTLIMKVLQSLQLDIKESSLKDLQQPITLKLFQLADYLYDKYKNQGSVDLNDIIKWLQENNLNDITRLLEQEELARQEQLRLEAQAKLEQEELARKEQLRLEQEELARQEQLKLEQEELAKQEQLRLEQEELAKQEQLRLEQEELARQEQFRLEQEELARQEQLRQEQLRLEQEELTRQEQLRLAEQQKFDTAAAQKLARQQREAEQARQHLTDTIIPLGKLKLELLDASNKVKKEHASSLETFLREYNTQEKSITDKQLIELLTQCFELKDVNPETVEYNNDNFQKINTLMKQLLQYPDLLPKLKETIFQACRVVVKIRSDNDEDTQPQPQAGGYRMQNVINVHQDSKRITLGDYCKQLNVGIDASKSQQSYGPFAAVYLPEHSQEYVYKQLFGNTKLNGNDSEYKTPVESTQDLMEQLRLNKNVVIFGFGFSGSGKTYTLIEGSLKLEDAQTNDKKSLLELFILDNIDQISSIEFLELYPKEKQTYDESTQTTQDIYGTLGRDDADADGFVRTLKDRLKTIEEHRYKNLTICATPNNDNSSRSFLMIKLMLINGGSLVFFDMPGTENTVRIRTQFLGNMFYREAEKNITRQYNNCETCTRKLDFIKSDAKIQSNLPTKLLVGRVLDTNFNVRKQMIIDYYQQRDIKIPPDQSSIERAFKNSITMATHLTTLFLEPSLDVQNYIITMSEAITLFFNGHPEKNFKSFLLNNITTPKDISIKLLDPSKIFQIVKYFLKEFIYKKKADGTYAYFTIDSTESKSSTLDENDLENIVKIFDLKLNKQQQSTKKLVLQNFNYNTLPFYELFEELAPAAAPAAAAAAAEEDMDSNINFKKNTHFKNIKFESKFIMIKYFMMLLCYVLSKTDNNKLSTQLRSTNYYGLTMVLIFTYKFINFIIEQGESIMTTLEHLKYYFLFNMDKIEEYNMRLFDGVNRPFKCEEPPILTPLPTTAAKKSQTSKTPVKTGTSQAAPATQHSPCDNLLYLNDNSARYTYDTRIGNITLKETVVMGGMFDYKLMGLLQKLNERTEDLRKLQFKNSKDGNYRYLDLGITPPKSMFVMFANMKAHVSKDDAKKDYNPNDNTLLENIKLICNAEADTLDFAQSVSSTAAERPAVAAAAAAEGGSRKGVIKPFRINKYLTSRMRKHTLKRLGKSRHHSIYSRRSKKYQS